MRVSILLRITADDGTAGSVEEVAAFEKATGRPEDVGLSLADGKTLTAAVQRRVVQNQAETWSARHRCCDKCGARRRSKGSYPIVLRTLYGDVPLASPRLHRCVCQPDEGPATVSPLRDLMPDHIAPERLYLEARWSSLVPYAAAAELGDERPCFIDGCQAEWQALPISEGRIVAALDGGYVRNWNDRTSNFELIVSRSVPEDRPPRCLGLVHGYDRNLSAGSSKC